MVGGGVDEWSWLALEKSFSLNGRKRGSPLSSPFSISWNFTGSHTSANVIYLYDLVINIHKWAQYHRCCRWLSFDSTRSSIYLLVVSSANLVISSPLSNEIYNFRHWSRIIMPNLQTPITFCSWNRGWIVSREPYTVEQLRPKKDSSSWKDNPIDTARRWW